LAVCVCERRLQRASAVEAAAEDRLMTDDV